MAEPVKDMTLPYGELFIDTQGEAHFICHTKGEDFFETRDALLKFIGVMQRQIKDERLCPYFTAREPE